MASAEVRCAIYTRKSTEEGLSQEFNSLDAASVRRPRHISTANAAYTGDSFPLATMMAVSVEATWIAPHCSSF